MRARTATILAAGLAIAASPTAAHATTISGTYYEDTASRSCPASTICEVQFPVLSTQLTGKFLRVDTLMCGFLGLDGASVQGSFMAISDAGSNKRRTTYFDPPPIGTMTFNRPVGQKVSGGPPRQLLYSVTLSKSVSTLILNCTIVGTILPE